MCAIAYCIAGKFRRRIFCDFVLKQTFRGIEFAICVLIVCICVLILMISQINFCKLDQIAKIAKFQPPKISRYMVVQSYTYVRTYVHTYVHCAVCVKIIILSFHVSLRLFSCLEC